MFTGIIEDIGTVSNVSKRASGVVLEVASLKASSDIAIGDSIAVNGVCLTVTAKKSALLSFDVTPQTLTITNLKKLTPRARVNLERAMKVGDRVSGHFVSGHIDCIGIIIDKRVTSEGLLFRVKIPAKFLSYIIARGSVAVDGISLTVAQKVADGFCICVIPHTLEHTTLKTKGPSDEVNIECDMFAKYAKEMLRGNAP